MVEDLASRVQKNLDDWCKTANVDTDVENLYHYTSIDNLQYFFDSNADLLATHCALLNDTREVFTGIDAFCNVLISDYGKDKDAVMRIKKELGEYAIKGVTRMPYVASFSTEGNSLSQWRAYTDFQRGGYALGFSKSKIENVVRENMRCKNDVGWMEFFGCCVYANNDNKNLDKIICDSVNAFQDVFDYYFANPENQDSLMDAIEVMVLLSAFIKHNGFAEEKEWRIVVVPGAFENEMLCNQQKMSRISSKETDEAEFKRAKMKVIGGKLRVDTRLAMLDGGLSSAMSNVICSPHGDKVQLCTILNALQCSCGLHFSKSSVSEITYRSC